jgi:arylformamidase
VRDRRVVFDFEIAFANGGGIQGQDFRLDIEEEGISDQELADYIVEDLRLLMRSSTSATSKNRTNAPTQPRGKVLSHPIRDGMITEPRATRSDDCDPPVPSRITQPLCGGERVPHR